MARNNGVLAKPPVNETKELKAKLAKTTDPKEQARINQRLTFLDRKGVKEKAAAARGPVNATRKQKLDGLTQGQNAVINQRQEADLSLGGMANDQLGNVQESFQQPFNWDALPDQVVGDDFNKWRQDQIDSTYADFSRRLEPQMKQEADAFEQEMMNRGIPIGSQLYEQQKSAMLQRQNDAKSSALVQAQGIAGQNAQQFFDVGSSAREQAYTNEARRRGMPLSDYMALVGAQSGMGSQNLQYSQALGAQQQGADLELRNAKQRPRGGGGGGEAWQQYGFSSPMEYDAYQDRRAQTKQQWAWENAPKGPKPPSYGSQIAGQIGGALVGAAADYYFSS
jgi:hypothetical protein